MCPCSREGVEHSQLMPEVAACVWERRGHWAQSGCPWGHCSPPTGLPSFRQIAKQSLRPFCTICNRYFKTPRKFVEHVKSQGHKDKAKEVAPAPLEDVSPGRPRALAEATQRVEVLAQLGLWGCPGRWGWHLSRLEQT